ncbi:hypothetical protein [Furfurilactobacillus entadae]|uniref:hypothetical protein n=1 Tax=Furfurilactobacillus entadae TaxID=2922307 RepID=UPI0035F0B713
MSQTEVRSYAKMINANDATHTVDELVTLLSQHDQEFAENVLAVSKGVAEREAEELAYDFA